jgi:hypothetical protein
MMLLVSVIGMCCLVLDVLRGGYGLGFCVFGVANH